MYVSVFLLLKLSKRSCPAYCRPEFKEGEEIWDWRASLCSLDDS